MRAVTVATALAAVAALVARQAVVVAVLAPVCIVLAFVVLGAAEGRQDGRVRDHLPHAGRVLVAVMSVLVALSAISVTIG